MTAWWSIVALIAAAPGDDRPPAALPVVAVPGSSPSTAYGAVLRAPPTAFADALPARLALLVAELDVRDRIVDPGELCVDEAPGAGAAPLADLLASSLRDAGFPETARCPPAPAPDDASGDRAAREGGFEWRLVVRPDDDGLTLELRAADRGFWAAPDLAVVVAWAREPRDRPDGDPASPIQPTPRPEPGVRLARALAVGQPVRAIAACDLTGDGVAEIAALTDERVLVWRERRGALVPFGEWSFGDLARAAIRVRDPIGGCVCAPLGPGGALRIAIGHSDLERGVVLAPRAEGSGVRFERERPLSGIPIAWLGGVLATAEPDQGRNRFGPALTLGDRRVELPRPILELAAPALGASGRAVALDAEHVLVSLSDAGGLGPALGTSGTGTAVVPLPGGGSYVAVTSRLRGPTDTLRLLDPATGATALGPVVVPGAIVASAAASSPRGPELWIAARTADGDRTVIHRLTWAEVRP